MIAGFPIDDVPFLTSVSQGIKRASWAQGGVDKKGFNLEPVQELIRLALVNLDKMFNLRTAALYVVLYCGAARFLEAAALKMSNILKNGRSISLLIDRRGTVR